METTEYLESLGMRTGLSGCTSDKNTQHRNKIQSCNQTLPKMKVSKVSMSLIPMLSLKFSCLSSPGSAKSQIPPTWNYIFLPQGTQFLRHALKQAQCHTSTSCKLYV